MHGGYYGASFQVFQGLTQGYPMSRTSINVVVDAVMRHWISLVAGVAGGQDRWVREAIHCNDFLYSGDGLAASTDQVRLQGESDTLTGLFDRLGIRENVSADPVAQWETSWKMLNSRGWHRRDSSTGTDSSYRFSVLTVGRTWSRG